MPQGILLFIPPTAQAKTDGDGIVYQRHLAVIQTTHMLPQAPLVNGADLLQKNDGILAQPHTAPGNVDMGRQPGFSGLTGDRCGDHRRRVPVTGIILYDKNGTGPSLFASDHRRQIRIEYISPLN